METSTVTSMVASMETATETSTETSTETLTEILMVTDQDVKCKRKSLQSLFRALTSLMFVCNLQFENKNGIITQYTSVNQLKGLNLRVWSTKV